MDFSFYIHWYVYYWIRAPNPSSHVCQKAVVRGEPSRNHTPVQKKKNSSDVHALARGVYQSQHFTDDVTDTRNGSSFPRKLLKNIGRIALTFHHFFLSLKLQIQRWLPWARPLNDHWHAEVAPESTSTFTSARSLETTLGTKSNQKKNIELYKEFVSLLVFST